MGRHTEKKMSRKTDIKTALGAPNAQRPTRNFQRSSAWALLRDRMSLILSGRQIGKQVSHLIYRQRRLQSLRHERYTHSSHRLHVASRKGFVYASWHANDNFLR